MSDRRNQVTNKDDIAMGRRTAKATAKSLELPAQEPEPLAHAPPEALELIAESA